MIRYALILLALFGFWSNAYSSTVLICNGKNSIAKYPNEKVSDTIHPVQKKVKIDGDSILIGFLGHDFNANAGAYNIISRSPGDELGIVGQAKHTINKVNTAPEIITIFGSEFESAMSITKLTGHFLYHDTYQCKRL